MNRKLPADPARRIHLHGVGEVSRPVDIDASVTGFHHLKSLRIYHFLPGQVIDGEAEGDEVCIVFLTGDLTMEVGGPASHRWTLEGRQSVFAGPPHVLYLPPHYSYRLAPHTACEVAYARSSAKGEWPTRLLRRESLAVQEEDGARMTHILGPGDAEALLCCEVVTKGRTWTPFPPHEHEFEQLSHFRFDTRSGFALARAFNDGVDQAFTVLEGDTLALERGFHTASVAPNCNAYALHVWAGPAVERAGTA